MLPKQIVIPKKFPDQTNGATVNIYNVNISQIHNNVIRYIKIMNADSLISLVITIIGVLQQNIYSITINNNIHE